MNLRWLAPISWQRMLYAIGLILGLLLFLWQVWMGWQQLEHFSQVSYLGSFALASLIIMLSVIAQITAWLLLMRGLGSGLTLRDAFQGYMLSFMPKYIPGGVWGYLGRSHWLYESHHVPYAVSGSGSFLEALVAVLTGGIIVWAYQLSAQPGFVIAISSGVVIALLILVWVCLREAWSWSLTRKVFARILGEKIRFDISLSNWILVIGLYVLLWICYGVCLWLLARAFGLQKGSIFDAMSVFCTAWLVGFFVVFAPSGLGIREYALSGLAATSFGLTASQASAVAVSSRLVVSLCEIAWIVVGVILGHVKKRPGMAFHSSSGDLEEKCT